MFVAGFIGSPQMNFLDGTLTKKGDQYAVDLGGDMIPLPKEKTADGKLDSYVGKKIKMGIRPEDIDDEPEFMAKHTDCQLDAQVDVSEMMGAEIYLYLEYKGNKMTARVAPTSKARNGDTVQRCIRSPQGPPVRRRDRADHPELNRPLATIIFDPPILRRPAEGNLGGSSAFWNEREIQALNAGRTASGEVPACKAQVRSYVTRVTSVTKSFSFSLAVAQSMWNLRHISKKMV